MKLDDVLDELAFGVAYRREGELGAMFGNPDYRLTSVEGNSIVMHPQKVRVLCVRFTKLTDRITHYLDLDSNWVALDG